MRGSVVLFRSCALSWSKLLLFGNLLCLCGLGSYWLAGSPLEAKGRGVPPGTTVIGGLAERGPERRYSVGNGNGAGSGDVSTSNFVNKVSPSHREGSPGKGEGVECGDRGGSCKEGSKTATENELNEKYPQHNDSSIHLVEYSSAKSTTLAYSLNSLKERGEFQREAMKRFCSSIYPAARNGTHTEEEEEYLYRHLLYDDSKRIIFCYVPKVGCSNWKRMFVVLNGVLPPTESSERPSEDILRSAFKLVSLKPEEREWRLKKYFKFTMLRNPLERIVSAYRNKVAVPIDYAHRWTFPSRDLIKMLKQFEPRTYQLWRARLGQVDVHPSFLSFLRFLSSTPRIELNEHFRPVLDLCRPCELDYDLYTNFKYLPDDALHLMDLFGIPHHYYLNREGHPHLQTGQLVHGYFKNITLLKSTSSDGHNGGSGLSVLRTLFSLWSDELSLYYSLFPEEKDYHKQYLQEGLRQESHHTDVDVTSTRS